MKPDRHHFFITIIVIGILGLGCSDDRVTGDDNLDPNATNIRLHNISEYDFQNVEINPLNELTQFGDLASGAKTGYQPFERAYRYAYVRLFIDGNEFIIQPIDYIGETPLGPGTFTYKIDVVDFENRSLSITTVPD